MKTEQLTRAECNALRGIAIIGIFLHNYCHWLNPIVKENEYTFSQKNVDWLNQVLIGMDGKILAHLLSFFGHYGVPVFLFLSAYGLVMKYEQRNQSLHATTRYHFIRYHFLKLFKMMIVGFVAFTMVDAITIGQHHYQFLDVVAQLLMFNNVLPDPDHIIWPGPYWFFGLMLQLYLVYRLLLYRRHWGWTVGLMAACVVIQMCLAPEGDALNRYRYNFMGGMLPFGFGLLYARYWHRSLSRGSLWGLLVLSLCADYLFSLNFYLWTFVPVWICLGSIAFVQLINPTGGQSLRSGIKERVFHPLEWVGTISAALFVCHPITRKIFIPISREGDIYTGLLLYIVASVCLAWLFKEVIKRIPSPKP